MVTGSIVHWVIVLAIFAFPAFLPLLIRPRRGNRFGPEPVPVKDLPDAITTCFRKYLDFEGRAGRGEYWWFFLFNALASIAVTVAVLGGVTVAGWAPLAWWLPYLAVTVRRLHDINRSPGWLALGFTLGFVTLLFMLAQPSARAEPKIIDVFE